MPEKSFAIVSPILGIKQDFPSIALQDSFLPDALDDMKNFIFRDGEIHRAKLRIKEFSQNLPDTVLGYYRFELRTETKHLLLFTKRDIARRNSSNDRLDYLTPQYATGTSSFVNGDKTVSGAGGADYTNLKAGDFISIGTTYSTDDTWYEIDSITNSTELELVIAYAEANSGAVAYLARVTYAGGDTDFWESITYNNKCISTNGVDVLQVWNASGQFTVLAGSPPIGKHLFVYENYVTLANLVVAAAPQPNSYAWCNLGIETDWIGGDAGSSELDDKFPISASKLWQGYWIMFTERSINKIHFIGGDLVFSVRRITVAAGAWAPQSVKVTDVGIFFYSFDHTFRVFTGSSWPKISGAIDKFMRTIHPEHEKNIYAGFSEEYNSVLFSLPNTSSTGNNNKVATYDLKAAGALDRWSFLDVAVAAFGDYEVEDDSTWDTLEFDTWNNWGWDKWDTRSGFVQAPHLVGSDYSGYTFQMFGDELDDGAAYTGEFVISTDLSRNKQTLARFKRVTRMIAIFRNEGSGTITVSAKRDYGPSFEEISNTLSLNGSEEFLFIDINTDLSFKNLLLKFSGTNKFRFIGIMFPEFELEDYR